MSKQTFQIIDIVILSIIACVIEGVLTFMSNQDNFIVEGFTVSFILLFSMIGLIRWGAFGVVPGIVSAITAIIIQNSYSNDIVSGYSIGMSIGSICGVISTLLMLLMFKYVAKKQIKEKIYYLCIYSILSYVLYIITYSVLWSIFDKIKLLSCFFTLVRWNMLNCLMSTIALYIASKQRGFLVDMNDYLIELHTVPDSVRLRKEINEDHPQSLMSEMVDGNEINDIALLDGGTLSEEDLIKLNKTFKEKEGENNYGTRKSE